MIVLTGVGVLFGSACSTKRSLVHERRVMVHGYEMKDSVFIGSMEAVRDSVVERTTVTVQLGAVGDTLFRSVVTDRTRASDRSRHNMLKSRSLVKTDTVFVEKKDSVLIKNGNQGRGSPLLLNLKWIFFVIIGLVALGVVLRIRT